MPLHSKRYLRKVSSLLTAVSLLLFSLPATIHAAGSFQALGVTISSTAAKQTGVSYTPNITLGTTDNVQQIDIQFATSDTGSPVRPSGLSLSTASLGSTTGLDGSWSLSTSNVATGLLSLVRATPVSMTSGTAISFALTGITNPAIGDCNPSTPTLTDTCYLIVTTFSDAGSTAVDTGSIAVKITEDPYLTFTVEGVAASTTTNGITSSYTSTSTSLPFGTLPVNTPKYITQKLTVSTNAPNGYTVYAELSESLSAIYQSSTFSPFGATNATWTSPQAWMTPTGQTSNSNTGWMGANITDTTVTGWSSGTSLKFGPISTSKKPITTSSGPQRSGKVTYITYVVGVNSLQGGNVYNGAISYHVEAEY